MDAITHVVYHLENMIFELIILANIPTIAPLVSSKKYKQNQVYNY